MGTWVKHTDKAIYLMEGNTYIDSIPKYPSQTNPKEQVASVTPMQSWFARSDRPTGMTISVGTGAPEPSPAPPDGNGPIIEYNGQLKVVNDTYFKTSPKMSSELGSADKVLVKRGTIFNINYFSDVGSYHWLIELAEPTIGDGTRTSWYVYTPDIRLMTDAILTVTYDTFFKLENKPSSQLPADKKVFVRQGTQFKLASFMPSTGSHTQIELANATLGPNNDTLWYVYNLHITAEPEGGDGGGEHNGLKMQAVTDTYFTLSPQPPENLPDEQKQLVPKDTIFDIQFYRNVGDNYWLVELANPDLATAKQTAWYVNIQDTRLLSGMTVTVTADTLFKREPKQSSALPDADKVFVPAGTQLSLLAHLPAAGNHTQIFLADTYLGPNQETTWYVYNPHVDIKGQRQFLQVVSDTVFKTSTASSTELPADQKIFVAKNTVFELISYTQPEKSHIKIYLKGAYLGPHQNNVWYCYVPDISIIGTEFANNPDDSNPGQPPETEDRGIPLTFPGFSGTYYSNDPIFWNTQYGERGHFSWGEALHVNNATGQYRRPANAGVIYGILEIAEALETIRKRFGDRPITINSWYRDPATNAAVGGASQSRHLTGDAVDFVVQGIHPFDVYANLDSWWGSRGGLASSSVFTHIDARGYRARWDYDGSGYVSRSNASEPAAKPTSTSGVTTWMKETDKAIYLMVGGSWISRLTKSPSPNNPAEQVLNITGMAKWFATDAAPNAMTIAIGTGAPEPPQWEDPETPPNSGQINDDGVELIKHFEGLRTTAYRDPVGIWTIGYGHTSMAGPPTVYEGMTITAAEAETILRQDLNVFEQGVNDAITIATNADQFSAMVSFSFNVGVSAFRNSTLLRKHNAADFAGAADEFLRWVYADGQVLPGLVRRRKAERALYLSEDWRQYT
jgi:GH24 family phage-related lysozyme (muramidase)/uncharacterized protein YcbK (DUF882 family)